MPGEPDQTQIEDILNNIESDAPIARDAPLPIIGAGSEDAPQTVNNSETVETDSAGVAYDPAIHTKGRAKTRDGRWRKAPPGRPKADAQAPRPASKSTIGGLPVGGASPAPEGEGAESGGAGMSLAAYRAAAAQVVGAAVGLHALALGEDWLAGEPEMRGLVDATAAYFVATGQTINLPPWVGLAGAYVAYAGPRFQKPKTLSRLTGYWKTVRKFWDKYKPKTSPLAALRKTEEVGASPKYESPVASGDWFGRAPQAI